MVVKTAPRVLYKRRFYTLIRVLSCVRASGRLGVQAIALPCICMCLRLLVHVFMHLLDRVSTCRLHIIHTHVFQFLQKVAD